MGYFPEVPPVLHGAVVTGCTDDGFLEFGQANPDLRIERPQGKSSYTTPAGFVSSAQGAEVAAQLRNWNRQYKLNRVADSSVGHRLPDGSTLPPGASWVSVAVWQTLPAATRRNFLPVSWWR